MKQFLFLFYISSLWFDYLFTLNLNYRGNGKKFRPTNILDNVSATFRVTEIFYAVFFSILKKFKSCF